MKADRPHWSSSSLGCNDALRDLGAPLGACMSQDGIDASAAGHRCRSGCRPPAGACDEARLWFGSECRSGMPGDDSAYRLEAERASIRPRSVQLREHAHPCGTVLASWNPDCGDVAQRWRDGSDPARRIDQAETRLVAW